MNQCLISPILAVVLAFAPMWAAGQTGTIHGQITDGETAQPLAGVSVQVGTAIFGSFAPLQATVTDAEGRYIFQVQAGFGVAIQINPPQPYLPIYWPDIVCLGIPCGFPGFGDLVVGAGETVTADAQVFRPGSLSGSVRRSDTLAPLSGARVTVVAISNASVLLETLTDSDGGYSIPSLPVGDFRIAAQTGPNLVAEVYDDIPCPRGCFGVQPGETAVPINPQALTAGIDFALDRAVTISGVVLDDVYPTLFRRVGVSASWQTDSGLELLMGVLTTDEGQFSFTGLPAGSYVLATYSGATEGYVNEVFDDRPCAQSACSETEISQGDRLNLAPGDNAQVIISLEPAASMAGCVSAANGGEPLPDVEVIVYKLVNFFGGLSANTVNSGRTGADGCYRIDHLPQGALYLRTFNTQGLVDQIYPATPCLPASCPATSAQSISVPLNGDLTGLDFTLPTGPSISATILHYAGGPVAQGRLNLFDASGNVVRVNDAMALPANADGSVQTYALNEGDYYLQVIQNHQVYVLGVPHQPGQQPPVLNGTPIAISNGQSANQLWVLDADGIMRDSFGGPPQPTTVRQD